MKSTKHFDVFIFFLYSFLTITLIAISLTYHKGDLLQFINGNNTERLDFFFKNITHFGNALILIPMVLFFLFIRFYHVLFLIFSGLTHGLFVLIFKKLLFPGTLRPTKYFENDVSLHFVEGVKIYGYNSFPSGHTATAFTFAMALSLISRKKRWAIVFTFLALFVGYSRIYLLQHFYIDVVIGYLLGISSAVICHYGLSIATLPQWVEARVWVNFGVGNTKQQTRLSQ